MRVFVTFSLAAALLGSFTFYARAQDSCDSAEGIAEVQDHASYIQHAVHVQSLETANVTDEDVGAELHEDQMTHPSAKKHKKSHQNVVFTATMYGAISAFSLPLGAAFGIVFHPVNKFVVARLMAFGGGALLFAVTVEMYGEMLRDLEIETEEGAEKPDEAWEVRMQQQKHANLMHSYGRSVCCMVFCLIGAWLYMRFNQWLNDWARGIKSSPEEVAAGEVLALPDHASPAIKVAMFSKQVTEGKEGTEEEAPATEAIVEAEKPEEEELSKKWATALAILAGTYVDGISEGVLIGAMARHGNLSVDFVVSVFVANIPEAFSTSSMLKDLKVPTWKIMMAWLALMVITGTMSLISCVALSSLDAHGAAAQLGTGMIEGLAAGAMMMMIISVMVPEVIEVEGDTSALIMILGFLASITIGVFSGYVSTWNHANCVLKQKDVTGDHVKKLVDVIFCD